MVEIPLFFCVLVIQAFPGVQKRLKKPLFLYRYVIPYIKYINRFKAIYGGYRCICLKRAKKGCKRLLYARHIQNKGIAKISVYGLILAVTSVLHFST